jgi:hypothetical protein
LPSSRSRLLSLFSHAGSWCPCTWVTPIFSLSSGWYAFSWDVRRPHPLAAGAPALGRTQHHILAAGAPALGRNQHHILAAGAPALGRTQHHSLYATPTLLAGGRCNCSSSDGHPHPDGPFRHGYYRPAALLLLGPARETGTPRRWSAVNVEGRTVAVVDDTSDAVSGNGPGISAREVGRKEGVSVVDV